MCDIKSKPSKQQKATHKQEKSMETDPEMKYDRIPNIKILNSCYKFYVIQRCKGKYQHNG